MYLQLSKRGSSAFQRTESLLSVLHLCVLRDASVTNSVPLVFSGASMVLANSAHGGWGPGRNRVETGSKPGGGG